MIKANSTGVSEVCDSLPSLDPFWAQNSLSILIVSINCLHNEPPWDLTNDLWCQVSNSMWLLWHVSCINNITQVGCSLHDMAYDWLLSLAIKYKITSSYFSPSLMQIACGLSLSTKYWRTVYVVWLFLQGAVLEISPQYLMPIFVTFLWLSSYDHSLREILSYLLMTEQHWPYMAIRHSMARHKDLKSMTYTSRFAFCRHQQVYWRH